MLARRGNSRPLFPVLSDDNVRHRGGASRLPPACFRCLDRPTANDARSTSATQQSPEHTHHVESLLIPF